MFIVVFLSSYMCDVTLRSEDGKDFPCHKCVLCARLGMCSFSFCFCTIALFHVSFLQYMFFNLSEYFRSMLGSCWIEVSHCIKHLLYLIWYVVCFVSHCIQDIILCSLVERNANMIIFNDQICIRFASFLTTNYVTKHAPSI